MSAINDHMCDSQVEGRFVTYVLCIVDTRNHEVVLSNAGHASPITRREGIMISDAGQPIRTSDPSSDESPAGRGGHWLACGSL